MNAVAHALTIPAIKPRIFQLFTLVGGVTVVAGLLFSPQQTWLNLLLVSYALVGIGLSGLFFVALQYITSSGWSVVIRRAAEAMTATLPVGALGLIIIFIIRPSLYPWMAEAANHADHLTGFKHFWLSRPFFLTRAVVYLTLWIAFSRAIIRRSRLQDNDGLAEHTIMNVRLSAIFTVIFAITFWLASFDWIMSLEPEWYSTIFGVYNFAGMFQSGLAIIIIIVVWLTQKGTLRGVVTEEHLHDLGKLLFAFSTFWMYIWFSQYMLIWYSNIPEEALYYTRRMHGAWQPLMLLNLFLNWVVPFLVLMSARTKKSYSIIAKVSIVVLCGRWLDLYLMITPSANFDKPLFSAIELGILIGTIGLATLLILKELRKASLVPIKDPYLYESLHHHQ